MEDNSPYKGAISAIDGMLACLIYFGKTGRSRLPTTFHDNLRLQMDSYWEHLQKIASSRTIPSSTTLFRAFNSSTQLYELAIFTFRNVLVGAKPVSLRAIFSLCSLSYITSQNYDNFWDIEVWRDALLDPQERQVFIDLAGVLWPRVSPTTDDALMSQIESSQPTSSSLEHLQGSAIVSNLICYLTKYGDKPHVFSGFGVTAKGLYSCIAFTQEGSEAKKRVDSCVQRLKSDTSSQNPCMEGILSIVERFVGLGYLQTPVELRNYLLCVGPEVIPEDEALMKFCVSVFASITVTRPPTPMDWSRVPCD